MKRRLQGLCLLLIGAVLGWVGGGELARMRGRLEPWPAVAVGLTLLAGLAAVFVGVVLVAGVPLVRRTDEDEGPKPPRGG